MMVSYAQREMAWSDLDELGLNDSDDPGVVISNGQMMTIAEWLQDDSPQLDEEAA